MRWIRTRVGDKAHAVFDSRHSASTLCGIGLKRACAITTPGQDDRCGRCDEVWREFGRLERPKPRQIQGAEYKPRYTYEDWENQL